MHACKRKCRKRPDYRRINTYFKSTKQYWRERNRRRTVWQLHSKGLTYPEIAAKLGVSEKTVQRDMVKVAPYWHRKMVNRWRQIQAEHKREVHRNLESMKPGEALKYLGELIEQQHNLWKRHNYVKKTLTFTVDIPEILRSLGGQSHGRPWITSRPNSLNCTLHDFQIHFRIKMKGQTFDYSTLTFT